MQSDDGDLASQLTQVVSIPIAQLKFDQPQTAFVAFKKVHGRDALPVGTFSTSLKFISKDCDPQTGEPDDEGYEDVYEVNTLCNFYYVENYTVGFGKTNTFVCA